MRRSSPHSRATSRAALQPRRGIATLLVMTALAISLLLALNWLKAATQERRQINTFEQRLKANVLAESALDRAAARLGANPEYLGETWRLEPDQFGGGDGATVTIRVEAPGQPAAERLVSVEVVMAREAEQRTRHSQQITVDLARLGEKP